MKHSKKGFSIMFAIVITVIASGMSLYLLSFTIPYSQNVKGLENSSKAYYMANSGIENALWTKSQSSLGDESNRLFSSGASDYSYDIAARGTQIPLTGQGNSSFDTEWNTIGYSNPLQLSIGDGMISDWGIVRFYFRVPDLDNDNDTGNQMIDGNSDTVILNWQLSSSTDTLLPSSTGAFITSTDINGSNHVSLSSRGGISLDNTTSMFSSFYASNCSSGSPCTLKISAIGDMAIDDVNKTLIPYLEYRIDTTNQEIPTRFTNIHASGKSFGFRKDVHVQIPQLTTDQAFDFTVFQ